MTDRVETYGVEESPHVSVYLHSGDVRFKEGDDGTVRVSMTGNSDILDSIEIDATSDSVVVRSPNKRRRWFGGSIDTVVTLPIGSDVTIHLGAGDTLVGLEVGDLEVHTGSGDVRIDEVTGTTEIKVGSGDVRASVLQGTCRVNTASGDVRLDSVTDVTVSTAAGDLYLGEVTESARVKSATGDIRIKKFSGSDLEIKTMSGDSSIGIIPGMTVNAAIKTLSGDFRNRVRPSTGERVGTMNLTVTSFAGDVTLKTAR